ncbi:hypothetical protein ElyMa_006975000 [Elysia marginata]|uniref:Isopenicillin N synthase-like Fe(2+) 2OG dioxygenase domain-containing protein n=1 Tax=Elysia marginata TaxID=1093978 RepID=A0AAV4JM36_9GAST|nr:hypothetical protein ElyMa_006975000 [Elysia marginata]
MRLELKVDKLPLSPVRTKSSDLLIVNLVDHSTVVRHGERLATTHRVAKQTDDKVGQVRMRSYETLTSRNGQTDCFQLLTSKSVSQ